MLGTTKRQQVYSLRLLSSVNEPSCVAAAARRPENSTLKRVIYKEVAYTDIAGENFCPTTVSRIIYQ